MSPQRVVITGGAGFLGSHLAFSHIATGDEVVVVDNLLTGREENLEWIIGNPRLTFLQEDVTEPGWGLGTVAHVDTVYHFASPASPPRYLAHPIETLSVGGAGTFNALETARECGARFILASTSEVYGDPEEVPQREDYWGNVNPIGPRSVYDEAKRYAEAVSMAYLRSRDTDVGIVRIFNTIGPRMSPDDGRVVPQFINQALNGEPMTVYGDGLQTRCLVYVSDLIKGVRLMAEKEGLSGPINLGDPSHPVSIQGLARRIADLVGVEPNIVYRPAVEDDPVVRIPDISLAKRYLKWEPSLSLSFALEQTLEWFKDERAKGEE